MINSVHNMHYSDRVNVDGLNIFRTVFIHSDHFIVSFSCHCDIFPSVSCKSSYVFDFSSADFDSINFVLIN